MLIVSSASVFRAICPHCRSVRILPIDEMRTFFEGKLPRPDWLAAEIECDCRIDNAEADSDHSESLS